MDDEIVGKEPVAIFINLASEYTTAKTSSRVIGKLQLIANFVKGCVFGVVILCGMSWAVDYEVEPTSVFGNTVKLHTFAAMVLVSPFWI